MFLVGLFENDVPGTKVCLDKEFLREFQKVLRRFRFQLYFFIFELKFAKSLFDEKTCTLTKCKTFPISR